MAKGDLIMMGTAYQEDGSIEATVWLWGSDHHRIAWDGVSPLRIDLDQAMQTALETIKADHHGPYRINAVSLSQSSDPFLSICVDKPEEAWDDDDIDADQIYTVLLDVKGQVIQPEVHTFKTEKSYGKFHDKIYAEHGAAVDDA